MANWSCEHSTFTIASRTQAWDYWTDMRHHAQLEPGVDKIELDGPFAAGTTGRTIGAGFRQEWELTDVVDGRRFGVTGFTPDRSGALSFSWRFEDEHNGTRITYRIGAYGPEVDENADELRQMEIRAPEALAQLAAELDRLSHE